ncbi:hypothetical protein ACFWMQ_11810 [Streptomyces sp. NPDC058372]|uniref:hypothetical protein n=1 Tax=Streptomyces sp. NPDC058372 TaxID=3346464 RepID=UPI00365D7181
MPSISPAQRAAADAHQAVADLYQQAHAAETADDHATAERLAARARIVAEHAATVAARA